ncbi:MAG: hypothetical protein P9L94_02675 [Candidatus Hinthialibacter antarcticus]|nr:hypothetical protein [Candidatus Hinthialibacter antarcticus]
MQVNVLVDTEILVSNKKDWRKEMFISSAKKLTYLTAITIACFVVFAQTAAAEEASPIQSGDVVFHSLYTCDLLPAFTGDSTASFIAHTKQKKTQVTYQRFIHAIFDGDQSWIEETVEADGQFFSSPVSTTYIYDGEFLAILDNVLGTFAKKPQSRPYSQTTYARNQLHPLYGGYNAQTIYTMIASVKNDSGLLPGITLERNGFVTTASAIYPDSEETIILASIEWDQDSEALFKKARFFVPSSKAAVEITNSTFKDLNGVRFPESIQIRLRFADTLDEFDNGRFISDQVLTVVSANFNQEIPQDTFSVDVPAGYAVAFQR